MEEVKIKHELYGEAEGQTANQLYKKYSAWSDANGKDKLNFTDWLDWAKSKGLVEERKEEEPQEEVIEEQSESVMENVKSNSGQIVIFWIAVLASIGIIVGFTKGK